MGRYLQISKFSQNWKYSNFQEKCPIGKSQYQSKASMSKCLRKLKSMKTKSQIFELPWMAVGWAAVSCFFGSQVSPLTDHRRRCGHVLFGFSFLSLRSRIFFLIIFWSNFVVLNHRSNPAILIWYLSLKEVKLIKLGQFTQKSNQSFKKIRKYQASFHS
jgi:hypothetical protein